MDFKNVQRRVYDALNVLSALNIIKKEKNKVSITEHGLEYLKKDGCTIPIKLQPASKPVQPVEKKLVVSGELKDLRVKFCIFCSQIILFLNFILGSRVSGI